MVATPLTNITALKTILTSPVSKLIPEISAVKNYISNYYKREAFSDRIDFFVNNAKMILSYEQMALLYEKFNNKTTSEKLEEILETSGSDIIKSRLSDLYVLVSKNNYNYNQSSEETLLKENIRDTITILYHNSTMEVKFQTGYIARCILNAARLNYYSEKNWLQEAQTYYDNALKTVISELNNSFASKELLINDFSKLCTYYYELIIAQEFIALNKTDNKIYLDIKDKANILYQKISPEDNLTQALPTADESKHDFEKIISKESAGEAEVSEYWADIISKMLNSKVVIKHDTKLETSYTTVVGFDNFLIYLQPKKEIEALAHLIHEAGHVECGFKGMQNFKGIENMFINLAEDIRINLAASSKYNGFIEGCKSYTGSTREKNNDMSEKSIRWINIFDKSCNKGENANYEEAKIFKIAQALGTTKIIEIPKNIYLQYLMRVKAYILTGTADPFAKFDKDNKENKENNDNENKPDANAGIKALVNILKENRKDKENTLLDSKSQDIIKKIKKHIKELEDNNYSENTKKDIIPGLKNIYSELKNMEYD